MKAIKPSFEILTELDDEKIGKFIELCARNCYRSQGAITKDSYKRIIKQVLIANGHEAMLEHFNITVKLTTDLHSYKDLTRHRHASFAIESTRWCDYSNTDKFKEVEFVEPYGLPKTSVIYNNWIKSCEQCIVDYKNAKSAKFSNDIASQFLNQSIKADVIITANIREWRYILKLRTAKDVYPNLRYLMIEILKAFKEKLPTFFEDIKFEEMPKEEELNTEVKEKVKANSEKSFSLLAPKSKPTDSEEVIDTLVSKLIHFKRFKDRGIAINGFALDYNSPVGRANLKHWIFKNIHRLEEIKFVTKIIDLELVNNHTNQNYYYGLDLLRNGNIELIITRDDSLVSMKKLKGYHEKYKEEFPNIHPGYNAQTIRFE